MLIKSPEIPVSLLLIFLFFITLSAQTKESMDVTMQYCLVAVASLSFGVLIVSCIRVLWNKYNEGRRQEEETRNNNPISPPLTPPISIFTITHLPSLSDFPRTVSPTTLPDYRHALFNAAVLHFNDDEKTKGGDNPPDYATIIAPQDSIGAPPSYHR